MVGREICGNNERRDRNGATRASILAPCRSSGPPTAVPEPAPVQPQTGSLFPWRRPLLLPQLRPPQRPPETSVGKQYGAQWQPAKVAATGSATWPQFLKSCRARLASTTSAPPQGGFASATPAPAPPKSGSLFPLQRPAAPPAGAARRPEADLRQRRKLSIVVPDQLSFGSTSIRTSTISWNTRFRPHQSGAYCARRRLRHQVIAQR
jgi:hypothetical protein